jgi:hypothetical protein
MMRLHFVTLETSQTHNAKAVGMVYVPYTDAEMLNWSTKGHADAIPDLVDRLVDLKTMLIQLRAHLPKTSAADAEVYENTKKLMIEAAHTSLVNTLIPTANTIEYFKHPFQTMLVTLDMFTRKMTSSTVKHMSLNTPSDVEKESIDDFAKIMDDASETILKKHLPTTTVLVDHLRTSQMVLYVNAAADNKNLLKDYSSIFKIDRADIATDMATDASPIDSTRLTIHKLNLDTTLLSAGYQEIAPPLSAVHVRGMDALATTVTTTLPPLRRAIAKPGAAADRAPLARPCFHCNKPGHTHPNCPQASTPASTVIATKLKEAYIEARDALRTTRETRILALATLAEESDTDVFIGEFCTLCPTLRHVPSKHRSTNLDSIFDGGPISWKSRHQDSVALSTSEVEYMTASEVGKEILYLRVILHDVGYTQTPSTNIYEDNLSSITVSTNPVRRKSSRHIDIHVYFCRELYAAGVMNLIPLRTHLMVADALTKSLPGPVLTQHREVMLGHTPFFTLLLH